MTAIEDSLGPHFEPLWKEFKADGSNLLVAGGYGLFLKQRWLAREADAKIVVPLERWPDANPRVTKDLDLVVGLDLIADQAANGRLLEALRLHGFKVTELPQGQRWQFVKDLGNKKRVVAELHVASPDPNDANFKADRIRVKRKPALGNDGSHGRHNPEAVGCELSPSSFEVEGVEIVVPNAVTWTVMKLTAASDRWRNSQGGNLDAEGRTFSREQAIKHAQDVCRAVAMMTEGERDAIEANFDALAATEAFRKAARAFEETFGMEVSWGREVLRDRWLHVDFELILEILAGWYRPHGPIEEGSEW
jgi:hypothetical protein